MNRSGRSVGAAADFYQLLPADLLVVCDDFNLPLGKLRFRSSGSAGGQKGLDDIINRLGSEEFSRLANRHRAGAGRVGRGRLCAGQVWCRRASNGRRGNRPGGRAVECWVADGIESG